MTQRKSGIAIACAGLLALSACGGGGGGGGGFPVAGLPAGAAPAPATAPEPRNVTLEKTSYFSGDAITIAGQVSGITSATLTFNDGQAFSLPVQADGNLVVPVVPRSLTGKPATLQIASSSGPFKTSSFSVQWLDAPTTKPGISAGIYLDASIANITSSIDELVTLSGDASNPEAVELASHRQLLQNLRAAITAVQDGQTVPLTDAATTPAVYLNLESLEVLDQFVLSLLAKTSVQPPAEKRLGKSELQANAIPSSSSIAISSLDCSALSPADRAWCANMRTQIANDLIINYAGMGATAAGFAAGALGALAAVGVAGAAFPAVVLGLGATATILVANGIAGSVQGASAYGTGTSQGTNVRDNIKNMVDAMRDLALAQFSKLIPSGGSALLKELNGALTSLAYDKLMARVDKLIADRTSTVTGCTAQASSGGQGSFAHRYDFGEPRALRLQYDAYTVPDQFSVYDGSGLLGGTSGLVSGTGVVAVTTTARFVTVKVNAPNQGTSWTYSISCGNQPQT